MSNYCYNAHFLIFSLDLLCDIKNAKCCSSGRRKTDETGNMFCKLSNQKFRSKRLPNFYANFYFFRFKKNGAVNFTFVCVCVCVRVYVCTCVCETLTFSLLDYIMAHQKFIPVGIQIFDALILETSYYWNFMSLLLEW